MIKVADDQRKVGGVALGGIWIGSAPEEQLGIRREYDIGAILNVAQDLSSTRGWEHGIEAMHVGLIDGPGNELCAYYAAILALHALLKRHNTMICCHGGWRSLAVVMMYMSVTTGHTWDELLSMLRERTDYDLAEPSAVHRDVFNKLDRYLLKKLIGVT